MEKGKSTVSSDSAGDLENLTRAHDMLFYLHLCVSLHLYLHAIPERFAGGSLGKACQKSARLQALPRWEHNPWI